MKSLLPMENKLLNDTSESIGRTWRLPTYLKAVLVTCISILIFGVASPAFATYYSYANNLATARYTEVTSSVVYGISGGRVLSNVAISEVLLQVRTFYGYPGYTLIAESTGSSPGWVYVSHPVNSAAYSSCNWAFSYDIGPVNLTCQYEK